MKLFRTLICVAMLMLPATQIQALAADSKPAWVNGYFDDLTNSYITTAQGIGATRDQARQKALQQVDYDRSHATGFRANISVSPSGDVYVTGNDQLTVKARVIDEYSEPLPDGTYRVSILVQVANNPRLPYESVRVTDRYKFTPAVFVPGMAQLKKGSVAKGAMFIALEAVGIGSIILTECQRASYTSKINQTHNASIRQSYIDKADNWQTGRDIAIAATCAVYVWNVIDGIVAKGKKHVVADRTQFALAPYCTPQASGLALNITF